MCSCWRYWIYARDLQLIYIRRNLFQQVLLNFRGIIFYGCYIADILLYTERCWFILTVNIRDYITDEIIGYTRICFAPSDFNWSRYEFKLFMRLYLLIFHNTVIKGYVDKIQFIFILILNIAWLRFWSNYFHNSFCIEFKPLFDKIE